MSTHVKKLSAAAVFMVVIMLCSISVFAAPKIKEKEYKGKGVVELDFAGKVRYKNVKLTVKDAKGKKVAASIIEKDQDDFNFRIKKVKAGAVYTFTIKGIRKTSEKKYGTVKGKIKVPSLKGKVKVRKTEYDAEDRELSFDFDGTVKWRKPTVTVTDGSREYVVKIDEKGKDDLDVKVHQLQRGKTYHYEITGVSYKNDNAYKKITGTFTA